MINEDCKNVILHPTRASNQRPKHGFITKFLINIFKKN